MTATETMTTDSVMPDQQSQFVATGKLFHALAADPKYRKKVLGLIKEAVPETPIPELDLQDAVMRGVEDKIKPATDEFRKLNERFDNLESRLTRKGWQDQHGLSDAELVEVEDLAKKESIGNAGAALELWRHRQTLGTPRGTRKAPPGAEEYLKKLQGTSPRDSKTLKAMATEEADRILTGMRRTG